MEVFIVILIIAALLGLVGAIIGNEQDKAEIDKIEAEYEVFVNKNGKPDIRISLLGLENSRNWIENDIYVYESSEKIFIKGEEYSFEDILSVSLMDEESFTTKSKNTISRAVVGGTIAGPAGAVIGGTTGRKETETNHNYNVCITVRNLQKPTIILEFHNNIILAQKILGLINNIIYINKK